MIVKLAPIKNSARGSLSNECEFPTIPTFDWDLRRRDRTQSQIFWSSPQFCSGNFNKRRWRFFFFEYGWDRVHGSGGDTHPRRNTDCELRCHLGKNCRLRKWTLRIRENVERPYWEAQEDKIRKFISVLLWRSLSIQIIVEDELLIAQSLREILQNACALLAYPDPTQSTMSYLLSPSEREPVYAALNSAILGEWFSLSWVSSILAGVLIRLSLTRLTFCKISPETGKTFWSFDDLPPFRVLRPSRKTTPGSCSCPL